MSSPQPATSPEPVITEPIPVRHALVWASLRLSTRGIDSAARDARILLRHALKCDERDLIAGHIQEVTPEAFEHFRELVLRRAQREPIAYIVGWRWFMDMQFKVDRRVLIPRPVTELLVEYVLALFGVTLYKGTPQTPVFAQLEQPRLADIGTGSGAVAVSLAKYLPAAIVYAVDISADALEVARENAQTHGVADRIVFLQGSYLEPLPEPVHVIAGNPPYIRRGAFADLDPDVRDYEPTVALDGGDDGMASYRTIVPKLAKHLVPGGVAVFEIGFEQARPLTGLVHSTYPQARVEVFKDYLGFDRVLRVWDITPAPAASNSPGE